VDGQKSPIGSSDGAHGREETANAVVGRNEGSAGARERRKEADRLLPVGSMGRAFALASAAAATAVMRKQFRTSNEGREEEKNLDGSENLCSCFRPLPRPRAVFPVGLVGGYLHRWWWWWLHCRWWGRWLLRSDRGAERRKKSSSHLYANSLSFCLSRHISSCWSLLFFEG
jgi:hypothetical protein